MLQTFLFCSLPIVGMLAFAIAINLVINRLKQLENGSK